MTHHNLPTAAAPAPALSASGATPNTSLARVQNPREWTQAKQAEFLRQLAATHCVSTAARSVGMARQSAYRLRNRLKGQPFDIAWACAFRRQFDALAEAALDRAMNGVEVPHYYRGELVGTHRVFNETLTLGLLARHHRLTPIPPDRHAEQYAIAPDDFEALVERVACGDELWADDAGEEDGEE
jgi:hypothetical protein